MDVQRLKHTDFLIKSMLHILQEVYTCVQLAHTPFCVCMRCCVTQSTCQSSFAPSNIHKVVCAFQENTMIPKLQGDAKSFPEYSRYVNQGLRILLRPITDIDRGGIQFKSRSS